LVKFAHNIIGVWDWGDIQRVLHFSTTANDLDATGHILMYMAKAMRGVLESMNYPAEDDCKVTVLAIDKDETSGSTGKSTMVNYSLVLVATLMVTTLATS